MAVVSYRDILKNLVTAAQGQPTTTPQPSSLTELNKLKEGGLQFNEIPRAVFLGFKSAFQIGRTGTVEAVKQVPESFKTGTKAIADIAKIPAAFGTGLGIGGAIGIAILVFAIARR